MSSVKKFFVHYSHFFTGSVLSQLLGLVSFPILTRILTQEDYGILGLVTTTMLLAVAMAKAGLSDGIIRFYKDYSDVPEQRKVFSSTIIVRGVILSAIITLLYITLFFLMNMYLHFNRNYIICFMIMSVFLLLRPLNVIVFNILRVTGRSVFYNVVMLTGRVISLAGALFLLIYVVGELYGYFIGVVFSELMVFAILFYWFLSNYKVSFSSISGPLALKLIKFGIPLLFSELSYLLLTYADRYMIAVYNGSGVLGLYSVGYNLAVYISDIIIFPLSYAIIPIYVDVYKKSGREETEQFLAKCMKYLVIAIIPVCVGYLAISQDLVSALASDKYRTAASFSPVILIGSLLMGTNAIFNAGLYIQKKTRSILFIMLSALAVNVTLNFLLLPTYGVYGAAASTLIACLLSTTLTVLLSGRYIRVKFNLNTIIFYAMVSGVMYLALRQISTGHAWSNLLLKISVGVIIFVPVVLYMEKEILQIVKNRLSARKTIS